MRVRFLSLCVLCLSSGCVDGSARGRGDRTLLRGAGGGSTDTSAGVDGTGGTGSSGTTDTGQAPSPTDPWLDDATWLSPGVNDVLLDMSQAPGSPHWEVWLTTSQDGEIWASPATHLAYNFSSLDLMVWQDGVLMVSGSTVYDPQRGVEAPSGCIFELHTMDLVTWATGLWEVQGLEHEFMTDPALHVEPDGTVQAVYYAHAAGVTPPESIKGEHVIKVADRVDGVFIERPEAIYSGEHLVDPVLCRWDGVAHLFATDQAVVTHAVEVDGVLQRDDDFLWNRQVPYCLGGSDEGRVVAQAGGGDGVPGQRRAEAGQTFSADAPIFDGDDPFNGGCTSPVMGRLGSQWALLCAVWIE